MCALRNRTGRNFTQVITKGNDFLLFGIQHSPDLSSSATIFLLGTDYMKNNVSVKVTKERRAELVSEIKIFFSKERDEEIGDLAAGRILDFILEKIAPEMYNQGVDDSYQYIKDAAEDLLSIRK
jgi:uncharacterized protein (DUF2164 family)